MRLRVDLWWEWFIRELPPQKFSHALETISREWFRLLGWLILATSFYLIPELLDEQQLALVPGGGAALAMVAAISVNIIVFYLIFYYGLKICEAAGSVLKIKGCMMLVAAFIIALIVFQITAGLVGIAVGFIGDAVEVVVIALYSQR